MTWTNHIILATSSIPVAPELDKSPGWSRGRAEPSALCRRCHAGCGGWQEGRATEVISKPGDKTLAIYPVPGNRHQYCREKTKDARALKWQSYCLCWKKKQKQQTKALANKGLGVYCYLHWRLHCSCVVHHPITLRAWNYISFLLQDYLQAAPTSTCTLKTAAKFWRW